MPNFTKFENSLSLLKCLLILYFMAAPRLMGHRHADIQGMDLNSQTLVTHLDRCHHGDTDPVDPQQFHVHWSLSQFPGEIPSSNVVCTDHQEELTSYEGLVDPMLCFVLCDALQAGNASPGPQIDALHGIPQDDSRSSFRRILLGVWIL